MDAETYNEQMSHCQRLNSGCASLRSLKDQINVEREKLIRKRPFAEGDLERAEDLLVTRMELDRLIPRAESACNQWLTLVCHLKNLAEPHRRIERH